MIRSTREYYSHLAKIGPEKWKFHLVFGKSRPEFSLLLFFAKDQGEVASSQAP